jgi:hypothetical protein
MNPNADVFLYEPAAGSVPEAVRTSQLQQVQSGESVVSSLVTGSMTQAGSSFPGNFMTQTE